MKNRKNVKEGFARAMILARKAKNGPGLSKKEREGKFAGFSKPRNVLKMFCLDSMEI